MLMIEIQSRKCVIEREGIIEALATCETAGTADGAGSGSR
jgi:hypothetical protein